jgi:predicted dehydrogenase
MNTGKKTKIALTGFENGHCNAIFLGMLKEPDVEIVAVSLTPGSKGAYYGRIKKDMFNGVDIFYNVEEMLNAHPEIEACVIGSSNHRHMEEFRLCAKSGIHVLSMKAPTYSIDEYNEMID